VQITIVEDDNRYNITTNASWITDPGQIISIDYSHTDDLLHRWIPSVNRRLLSSDDSLEVILYDVPAPYDEWAIQVTARRFYDAFVEDTDTVTCPLPLIRAQFKVEVLEKIFNKLGQAAKQNYGMEIAIAEKELEKMRLRYRQVITPVNMVVGEQFTAVDVPLYDVDHGNWT
jgi:hypothetical protein